jgi:hypothetical protein
MLQAALTVHLIRKVPKYGITLEISEAVELASGTPKKGLRPDKTALLSL